MALPYMIQGNNIVVFVNNKPYQVGPTHIGYEKIKQAIKDSDWDSVQDLVEPKKIILQYAEGNLRIDGDKLLWKNEELHGALATRLINMYKEGFPISPLVKFVDNLMNNPSKRAVTELYGFLEKNTLPITDDGYFLAYKRVKSSYYDVYSSTVINKPADLFTPEEIATLPVTSKFGVTTEIVNGVTTVSMARNKVDDKAENTCSEGLHFCSIDYLGSFGGERIVILKINPADVVSIPVDYNFSKGRCSKYEVIGEHADTSTPETAFTSTVDSRAPASNKPVSKTVSGEGVTQTIAGRWIRANGTFASKAEIQAAKALWANKP